MSRCFYQVAIILIMAAGSQAAIPSFADRLYPILQKANCRTCHVDGGIASATRLHFPETGAPPDQIEAFGRSLAVLVNSAQPEASPLVTKPTLREKHTGGKLIQPGSPEESALLDWVRQLARMPPAAAAPASAA